MDDEVANKLREWKLEELEEAFRGEWTMNYNVQCIPKLILVPPAGPGRPKLHFTGNAHSLSLSLSLSPSLT